MPSPIDALERDILRVCGHPPPDPLRAARSGLTEAAYPKGSVIFSQGRIGDRWLFVSEGVAASEQISADGDATIARFFEPGQFAGNLTSTFRRAHGDDQLIAVADVEGVLLPHEHFLREYMEGGALGAYLRLKMIEHLLFAKEVVAAKTTNDTEAKYRFLEDAHGRTLHLIPKMMIARFLGITPQGLSRFLRSSGRRDA